MFVHLKHFDVEKLGGGQGSEGREGWAYVRALKEMKVFSIEL